MPVELFKKIILDNMREQKSILKTRLQKWK